MGKYSSTAPGCLFTDETAQAHAQNLIVFPLRRSWRFEEETDLS